MLKLLIIDCYCNWCARVRGGVAQSVRLSTLIHEVVGSNPAVVILSVLPKLGGWMTMLQRSKSRPTKVGLAPGEVPQCRLQLRSYHSLSVSRVEMQVPKGQFMYPTH